MLNAKELVAPEEVVINLAKEPNSNEDYEFYRVQKMKYPTKKEKDKILYNFNISIENIPAKVYEYVVNGKSAVEWVMERYQVTQNKDSLIVNDPNDGSLEHGKPRYILDLLLSVMTVSLETVDIVNSLPKLKLG